MNLEKIIETVFAVIFLSAIGFLTAQVFDMKGTLSSVSSKLESADNRISRIAEVLPEVKARVAWEEVNEPLRGFVLTSNSNEISLGKWMTIWKTYNAETSELKTFKATLSEAHKEHLTNVVAGKIRTVDRYAPTFTELAHHSAENKEPIMIPAKLNLDTSYVIRNDNVTTIEDYLLKISTEKPNVSRIEKLSNWKELSQKLDELASDQDKNLNQRIGKK